jgi:hypothetical protein
MGMTTDPIAAARAAAGSRARPAAGDDPAASRRTVVFMKTSRIPRAAVLRRYRGDGHTRLRNALSKNPYMILFIELTKAFERSFPNSSWLRT